VPFPCAYRETLALHIDSARVAGATYLFESSRKKPYTDRGVRKIFARYTATAGITASISPHTLRHFLFTWLETQGIDAALIQLYSGHATRQSLEIYSRLALADAQDSYDKVMDQFPSEPDKGGRHRCHRTGATGVCPTRPASATLSRRSPARCPASPSVWLSLRQSGMALATNQQACRLGSAPAMLAWPSTQPADPIRKPCGARELSDPVPMRIQDHP
jgi:hypothetical protein